jgi:hypothetical protein
MSDGSWHSPFESQQPAQLLGPQPAAGPPSAPPLPMQAPPVEAGAHVTSAPVHSVHARPCDPQSSACVAGRQTFAAQQPAQFPGPHAGAPSGSVPASSREPHTPPPPPESGGTQTSPRDEQSTHACPPKPHSISLVPGTLPLAEQQPLVGEQLTVGPPDPDPLLEAPPPELVPPELPPPGLLPPELPPPVLVPPELLPIVPPELLVVPAAVPPSWISPPPPKRDVLPQLTRKTANTTRATQHRFIEILSMKHGLARVSSARNRRMDVRFGVPMRTRCEEALSPSFPAERTAHASRASRPAEHRSSSPDAVIDAIGTTT